MFLAEHKLENESIIVLTSRMYLAQPELESINMNTSYDTYIQIYTCKYTYKYTYMLRILCFD